MVMDVDLDVWADEYYENSWTDGWMSDYV